MISLLRVLIARLAAVVLLGLVAVPAMAQQRRHSTATALLPSSHWSIAASRRLAELDLASSEFAWGDGSLTIAAVGDVLRDAVILARKRHPELVPLATGYWLRFTAEFPATTSAIDSHSQAVQLPVDGWLSIGYSHADGRVYPVRSVDRSRENVEGPFPRPTLSELDARANVSMAIGSHLAVSISPEHRDERWSIYEGFALISAGKLGVWGGRRAPAFAAGAGGGIVFNGTAAFTGGGIMFTEPVRLPWVLGHLGVIRFETFLSNADSNAAVRRPWVLGTHASISPHPRVLIGATQAFMFGGEGVGPFTWRNFKEMFLSHTVNITGSEFENGIVSVDLRFRPPLPWVPLTLYLEWGADDNHSAWTLFPGIVAGAHVAAVPGMTALSLGLEHAYFAGPCRPHEQGCHTEYYATWYRHYLFKDGWTMDRQPIGHPLGGDGSEWLVYGTWDNPSNRLRLNARGFVRERGAYNIYSPEREGRSVGGALSAVYRAASGVDLMLTGALENGESDWHESSLFAGLRRTF